MRNQRRWSGGPATDRGALRSDFFGQDPVVRVVRRLRWAFRLRGKPILALAALALIGVGVAIGVALPSRQTVGVEHGTVTWVNEGMPTWRVHGQEVTATGPVLFLARLDGTPKPQVFELASDFYWTTAGNAGWTEGSPTGPVPPCMVPMLHGKPARFGVGKTRVRIKFGVVSIPMPVDQITNVAVWVECPQ